ncbi:MAG: copper amine oxidase N-terminal domain-containing protein [Defluviitaleaceae bacterium]|nr:copper amine oxidase N-terminal domain-containing protein [Defluviitaleaceae bacterium]
MKKKHLFVVLCILIVGFMTTIFYSSSRPYAPHLHTRSSRNVAAAAAASSSSGGGSIGMGSRWNLENAVGIATDIVVAEFVERRPAGQTASEYEFKVLDRICGNAADTIFVYVFYQEVGRNFADPAFQFTPGTQYLLTLVRLADVYTSLHLGGFVFASDMILNLDDPSLSTMYGQSLSLHSYLNFDSIGLTRAEVISYVRSLPRDPFVTIGRVFITSEYLRDIIIGSPYVIVIEIGEPRRLACEVYSSEFISTDIYYATVVEVLKGNMQVGDLLRVIFFSGTVFPGETHIVSITPTDPSAPDPYFHEFTSRDSLHCLDQRDEIMAIIRGPRHPGTASSATPTPSPTPAPSPTPTPAPTHTPAVGPSRFSAAPYNPDDASDIQLINIEINLPEDFVTPILEIDDLNALFLLEQIHSIAVADDDTRTIISVYIGDLSFSDIQLLMFMGFEIDLDTGDYTVIPGRFSTDRSYFYFEFVGSGIIGAFVYEMPTPLLRLTINQYDYYYRGTPQTSDVAPFITGNRTMVPIRLVSEALGASPRWIRQTRTAHIYYNNTILRLPVGEQLPDGMGTPILRNNRVLVPLRFVIENFDAFTFWDRELREVTVYVLD